MDTNQIARNVASKMSTWNLQRVRAVIEVELISFCATRRAGTQAHLGQIEMLEAVSAELDARS